MSEETEQENPTLSRVYQQLFLVRRFNCSITNSFLRLVFNSYHLIQNYYLNSVKTQIFSSFEVTQKIRLRNRSKFEMNVV